MAIPFFSHLSTERQNELAAALQTLPPARRRLLVGLGVVLVAAVIGLLWQINNLVSVEVPSAGGSLHEGIVGTPRFINPLLAISDADRDLTALTYSGLMRAMPEGELTPDLAASHQVSEDGLTHTFILRSDLTWHDGQPLTASDVAFTIAKAQDPLLKSPRRPNWEGVRVEVVNDHEIKFHLKERYPAFLEVATMGILPQHLWSNLAIDQFSFTDLNNSPVGSGPYRVTKVTRDDDGIPREMELAAFNNFALGRPYLRRLIITFYPTETSLIEAYQQSEIESLSAISASAAAALEEGGANIKHLPLPRVFAVFFNQNKSQVFTQKEVRLALSQAIDRQALVEKILHGYGLPTAEPLPTANASSTLVASSTDPLAQARATLTAGGWTWNASSESWSKKIKNETVPLRFNLATAETPELREAAEFVKTSWEKLGVTVDLKIYELGDLNQDVIRPREYESLLFGQVLGRVPDLASFWHSSQRLDPGLNIALYTNITVDKLLAEMRATPDEAEREELNARIAKTIAADVPAAFLYAPDLVYLVPARIKNVSFPQPNTASDRFAAIHTWYSATDRIWKIFNQ